MRFSLKVLLAAALAISVSCSQRPAIFTTESASYADTTDHAVFSINVELPVANSPEFKLMRDTLVAVLAKDLQTIGFTDDEKFPIPACDTDNIDSLVLCYGKAAEANIYSLAKEDYDERAQYIMEDAPEDMDELLAQIPVWESDMKIEKTEQTDTYVVFTSSNYVYMGGAHGGVVGSGALTFDLKTGKRLSQFVDPSKIEEIQPVLVAGLMKYYAGNYEPVTEEQLFERLDIDGPQIPLPAFQPCPSADGLTFTYQPYEIACYADGMPSFAVSYEEVLPYLTEEAKAVLGL